MLRQFRRRHPAPSEGCQDLLLAIQQQPGTDARLRVRRYEVHRPMALHRVDQDAAHGSTVGESMTTFMRLAVESK
jgi:hypothetical protein